MDTFIIAGENDSTKYVCQFTPCARCGKLVLNTGSPLEKFIGSKRTCNICIRLARGDDGRADSATREKALGNFLRLFKG